MNSDVIEAFMASTTAVFETILGVPVKSNQPSGDSPIVARGVSGIIGLTGVISGDIIVCFDESIAIKTTGIMLGSEPGELNDDVVDAVGELTNMIAGNAKGRLEKYNLSLALPTVILGSGHRIGFKSGIKPLSIHFDSELGSFSVELGLSEASVPVGAA
ncbi:MAG: chemotaxis protein CheX [Rubripirellula sp.]